MAITELSLRAHDKWFNARNLIETRWEQLTLRGSSLSPDLKLRSRMTNLWNNLAPSRFLPDFNVNTYIPDIEFDLDLTQHIPQMGFEEHLASLDINMSEIIPDLDLLKPSNLPLPNYRQSAATAQNALLSAAAYLSTRPSTESPEIEYYPY